MFRLKLGDFWRGLIMAIIAPVMVAVFVVLNRIIFDPSFDVFSVDFPSLLRQLTNVFIVSAYGAGTGYLIKNLLTDDSQKFLGVVE